MKSILLLGGSAQQLVAIRAAKKLGFRTILCDYLTDNPGQYEVDKFYNISTTEVESVYKVASDERVDGVLAYASDPAALPAAIIAERLGLPTNPSSSVEILGVKHKFRKFLQSHNFACPQNISFSQDISDEELKTKISSFRFPIIIKPTDSSGSKGVSKLDNTDNLREAIKRAEQYSRNKVLIVEEFIERGYPNVIGGDIFVWNGIISLYGEMACFRDNKGKGLIPIGKKKPSGLNGQRTERVHNELQRLVTALGIQFGELNIEIILGRNDDVYFLELGARAGGNMIPIQLSDAFGTDLVKANILAAMGEDPCLSLKEQSGCYMHYVLHSYANGKFESIWISPKIEQFVYRKVIYKKKGDDVEYFDGAGKALGIIFLHFENKEQMDDFCEHHGEYVKVILM